MNVKKTKKTDIASKLGRNIDNILTFAMWYGFVCVCVNSIVHYLQPSFTFLVANLEIILGGLIGAMYRKRS